MCVCVCVCVCVYACVISDVCVILCAKQVLFMIQRVNGNHSNLEDKVLYL